MHGRISYGPALTRNTKEIASVYQSDIVVVVFFTLTDRASTIIHSNIRGCQSGTWSELFQLINQITILRALVIVWSSHIIYSKSMDEPGKVGIPAHGQLNRKNKSFLSLCASENLVS